MLNRDFFALWLMLAGSALSSGCAVRANDSHSPGDVQTPSGLGEVASTTAGSRVPVTSTTSGAATSITSGAVTSTAEGAATDGPLLNPNAALPQGPTTGLARYTLVGRFTTADPNDVVFGLLGSRIGLSFTGTSITMMMADSGTDYFDVVIDGNRQSAPVIVNPNTAPQPYALAQNLTVGTHTLWLAKRTEAMQDSTMVLGVAHLADMILDADALFLTPPAARSRRIEFVGDSGYTGYGVEAIIGTPGTSNCPYSGATQNALKSIPEFTADFLNADAVNASVSGKGVYLSLYDPSNSAHTFPVLWPMTYPPSGPPYSFNPTSTDAVVLSVGGDDLWGDNGIGYFPNPTYPYDSSPVSASDPYGADANFFVRAMSSFLVQIRT